MKKRTKVDIVHEVFSCSLRNETARVKLLERHGIRPMKWDAALAELASEKLVVKSGEALVLGQQGLSFLVANRALSD